MAGAWTDSLRCHWHRSRSFSTLYASEDKEIDRLSVEFSMEMLHKRALRFPAIVAPPAEDEQGKRRLSEWWKETDSRDIYLEEQQQRITLSDARRAFRLTDRDLNGQLDMDECKEAFVELNLMSDETDMEYYFEQLDVDQSGALG